MTDRLLRIEPLPYPSRLDPIDLPRGPIELWRPPRAEALLERMIEGEIDPDEKLPYWADLWPAAVGLAEAIADGTVGVAPGQRWMELGAGLGLVSLAAARQGARVVATDWIDESLCYVRASAERAGLEVETRVLDWRGPPSDLSPSHVLASDVLYEARNGPWLKALLERWRKPGFELWLADPGRAHVEPFLASLDAWDIEPTRKTIRNSALPTGRATIVLHRIEPREPEAR